MTPTTFADVVDIFVDLIALVLPVLIALAVLSFFWGLAKFIFKAGDEKAVTEGKSLIIWGVVALFIMLSVWGILRFLYGEFGFTQFGLPLLPEGEIQ